MKPDRFVQSKEGVDYYQRTCYHSPPTIMRDWDRDDPLPEQCFEMAQGKVLIGIVDQLLDKISSLEMCQKSCLDAKKNSGVVCKSAMWYPKEKECIIASQDKHDIAELYIEDPNSVYLENKCAEGAKATENSIIASTSTTASPITLNTLVSQPAATGAEDDDDDITDEPFHVEGEHPMNSLNSVAAPPAQQPDPPIEESGYGNSRQAVNSVTQTESPLTPAATIDPKVIDSYQMPEKKDEAPVEAKTPAISDYYGKPSMGVEATPNKYQTVPPSLAVVNPDPYQEPKSSAVEATPTSGYRRRLRDDRMSKCFSEVNPTYPLMAERVMKAYSIEQCADICRLCRFCLRGQRCAGMAFDLIRENCALSSRALDNGGRPDSTSSMVYFARSALC
ncbi:unnamed protein product, partial [Mesorhabditis spiculigera]